MSAVPGVRNQLVAERAEALVRLASVSREFSSVVESSEGDNADDEHDPEGATIAFERAQLSFLREQAAERVAEFDRALARFDGGNYGHCLRCGKAIGAHRLAARPAAETCIDCASG